MDSTKTWQQRIGHYACLLGLCAGGLTTANAAAVETTGWVKLELFNGITGTPVQNLYDSEKWINNTPDAVRYAKGATFATLGDNYGARMTGVFIPPVTGEYHFFIRSDDASELYLNNTGPEIPAADGANFIAQELDCCDAFMEPDSGDSATTATPIMLTAGQRYGFTYIVKEGTGGDNGHIAWRRVGDTTAAASLSPLQGIYVASMAESTGASLTITNDLQDISLPESSRLTLSVGVDAKTSATLQPAGASYHWFKNGQPLNSYGATYVVNLVRKGSEDGAKYKAVITVPGAPAVTTREATVTVTDDVTAPTLVSARAARNFTDVTVVFSEPVDPVLAGTASNYSFSPGLNVTGATVVNSTTVRLTTAVQTEGTDYTLTVSNVKDTSAAANPVAANTTATFKSWFRTKGYLTAEFFTGISGSSSVQLLLDAAKYQNNTPDQTRFMGSFETPNAFGDNYGARVTAWLVPKESGSYHFFVRADDRAALFINTTGDTFPDPTVDTAIAEASSRCCQPFQEVDAGSTETTAAPIDLVAGRKYPVLLLMKEGGGGDFSQVAWRKEGDTTPATALRPMPGDLFETYVDATGASINVTTAPMNTTVLQNRSAKLTVAATTSSPAVYQWFKNDVEIGGATATSYTIPPAQLSDNNAKYTVRIRIPGLEVTREATLTVTPDTVPPVLEAAGAFIGGSTVGVAFDEGLDKASAEMATNFQVSGGTVTAATLRAGKIVELTLAGPVGDSFTVTANGVKDVAGNAMASVTVTGKFSDMTAVDVGDLSMPGRAFTWGNGYFVSGGGNDIWGTADEMHFVYKSVTGPFDVRARVDSLQYGDEWGKATLMARETIETGSRNQAIVITKNGPYPGPGEVANGPSIAGGVNVYTYQWRDATDAASASKPTAERVSPTVFPSWIRLVRESETTNQMKGYISYDGQTWIAYHTYTTPGEALPATLLVGMAVTSHDDTPDFPLAEVVYNNFSLVPFGLVVDPKLRVAKAANGQITISWDSGTLQASQTVNGTYGPVANATSPLTVTPGGQSMFYRVRTQ